MGTQAGYDAIDIGDGLATQPPYVGRARHLLIHGSAILLRRRGASQGSDAADRDGKAEKDTLRCHVRFSYSSIEFTIFCKRAAAKPQPAHSLSTCSMIEAEEGSIETTKCEEVDYPTLPIFLTAAISRALSSATNFENPGASIWATGLPAVSNVLMSSGAFTAPAMASRRRVMIGCGKAFCANRPAQM